MISFFKRRIINGRIRAEQVAPYIGAKVNPETDYENDICIYIKQQPHGGKSQYIDLIDNPRYISYLKEHPDINAIAISKMAYDYLKSLIENKVYCIPQQHCNFENIKRDRTEIKVVGFIGDQRTFRPYEDEFRDKLSKIGMELKIDYYYKERWQVSHFYSNIDIQLVYRIDADAPKLKNSLKLYNAGSFGIPTVAKVEESFNIDFNGAYLPVLNIDEAIARINDLKNDEKLYKEYSELAIKKSEYYHIENISKLYLELE